MTAPRPREQRRPPSPPDRQPRRRGGVSSPCTHAASAAGRPAGPARLFGARRGLARSARALAAAALLALSGALALPATAVAQEIALVSNIGTIGTGTSSLSVDGYLLGAQAFTVGADDGDYTLASIELPFRNREISSANIGSLNVSVWSADSSNHPESSLYTLTNPSSIAANTTATFTAPAVSTLEAGMTYVVVVDYDYGAQFAGADWRTTDSNAEDANPAPGWTIADGSLGRARAGTMWNTNSRAAAIRVNGRAVVIPPGLEVTLRLSDDVVLEDATSITVTASVTPATPVAFTVEISANPVAPATDDEFELSANRTLSFAAGATQSTGTVTIRPVDDEDPELPDVVTISGAVSNAAIPDPDDVTLTIHNNDVESFEVVIDAPAAVDESAGTATVTYTLTKRDGAPEALTDVIFYHRDAETATRGVDYTPPVGDLYGGRLVVIELGLPPSAFSNTAGTVWVAEGSFTIGIVDDEKAELDETIVFTVEAGKGASPEQTITIRDDDTYVTSVVVASEPQSGDTYRLHETIVFTVSFSVPVELKPHGRLRLKVGLDNPGGGSGNSVEAVFSRLTREQYPTADTPQISRARHMHFEYKVKSFDRDSDGVRIRSNALRLASGARIQNGEVGGDARLDHGGVGPFSDHKVDARADVPRIEDIGVVSTPRLRWPGSSEEDTYGEGENIRIGVRFDQPVHVEGEPTMALAVGDPCGSVCEARYESGSGTDTLVFAYLVLDVDFDRNGIAIPANPVEVVSGDSIRNDAGDEAHLSFGREGTQSGHKVDGSRAAGPHLSVENAQAQEADGKMDFTVRLEPHGLGIVTVEYRTHDGSARAGSDYTETSGTLRFNSREMERTVSVPIIDDAHEDDGETFSLRLSNPTGATLRDGDREATGTIRNSDPVALSASFPASAFASASHSGADDRPQAVVAFSQAVAAFAADTPSVSVTGGRVASVQPHAEDGLKHAWVFFLVPDGGDDVTFALVAEAACAAGGICTPGGRTLTEVPAASTIPGAGAPEELEEAPLTASFADLPGEHDGESAFRFRVAFSEDIGISYRSLREDAFQVAGGRVTRGKRVDDRRDLFEITVEPEGAGDVAISLPAGRECTVSGAICTKGENRRQLTNAPAATVAGPPAVPLTASFVDVPGEHDGESAFTLRMAFSEPLSWMNGRRLRENVVAVAGGQATSASRVNRRRDLWQVTIEPNSLADVTVTLEAGAACGTPAAVCTSDGRALSNTISTTVPGPVALSVADARAEEGTDETIDFAVSLSRAASGTVTVAWATADGTATAGEDYTRSGGTLSFAPGETEKTVRVPVLDDAIDEGEETFTLRLTNASGAVIADGEATGTIENSDPLQKMWLSRFGRTVAGQVVDAVAGRLSGPAPGSQVKLGGQSIDLSSLSADAADARRSLAGALGAAQAGSWDDPETGGTVRSLTGREMLLGSSFHLAAGDGKAGGPGYAAWGRVAVGGFEAKAPAEKGEVRLDGEVTTGIFGADAQWERWLAGVAFSVSEGDGSFDQPGVDSGTVESSLTSVNPYVRYEASDRLSVWGLVGYGTGDMTMTQAANDKRDHRIVTRTDISMRLGAGGARGVLLEADEDGGIDLALRGDAFLVQMGSEAAANTVETKADASRLRLVLEAGRPFALGEGAVLAPALELGLPHDGGDAETGTGVEVGGRIRYTDAGSGLTVEANARTLVAHEDSDYEEWGVSGSVRIDPGASGRGLSLSLAPVWGTPSSGVERLWSARDAAGLAPDDDFEAERRLEGEIGYGLGAFGGAFTGTPNLGFGLSDSARVYRIGWRLTPAVRGDSGLEVNLDATRREAAGDDAAPEKAIGLELRVRF